MSDLQNPTIPRRCPCGSGRHARTIHDETGRYLMLGCDKCELEARVLYELDPPAPSDTD